MDYGKGYRIGSEFWKQQERIGDDITGMHMTLTQTERGYPAPVDHIDVPQSIKEEKGETDYKKGSFWQRPKTPIHYPWHKSPYLQDRTKQLAPVINDLDPHKPELTNLEIIGTSNPYPKTPSKQQIEEDGPTIISDGGMTASLDEEELNLDPLRNHPDVIPAPIFGPSLQFAQQAARWTGDSHSFEGRVGLEARVSFECYSGQRCTSFLEIKNDGTTSIYFDWKRLPKTNPFDIVNARVQRFYFDTSNGVILPGDTMKFPFVFKSPNSGVFTEQWQFETKPVVCGGAALMVTLRGVALQEDKFYEQRRELEKELARKQAEQIIQQILHDITDGIKTPDRALSPIDAYITDEEIFQRENTEMHYNHEAVNVLRELYKEFFPEEEREFREWDLSVQNFKEMVMGMDEDDERKEEFLQRMNLAMITLSFPAFNATQQKMYSVGYQLLSEAVDDMVQQSVMLRSVMGLPDKEEDELPTDPTDSKRGRPPDGKKAQDKKKDIGKPPKGKEAGAPKKSSSPTKQLKGGIRGVGDSLNRTGTPTSLAPTPIPGADPTVDKKYKDKLYIQMYKLLQDSLDKMDFMFKDIQTVENFDELENLMKTLG
ncbi:unnamed protein product [Owenia fusiformis]|uniref:MYCBP-associated protein n=1 Tax=Owenia fusiformis TaxID=6347 RepID=A0A8S4P555_OWEFU|nr:unnamed protein product [Owenia fusiformis]